MHECLLWFDDNYQPMLLVFDQCLANLVQIALRGSRRVTKLGKREREREGGSMTGNGNKGVSH